MKYIIMCGGRYEFWQEPRQLLRIQGETIVARTIRLLKENGITDIAISSNDPRFKGLGVPVLHHQNEYVARGEIVAGFWHECFYPSDDPVCYIFGDVVFSPRAIRTIVEKKVYGIEFFASAPPFSDNYAKTYAEPFALKVKDQILLKRSIKTTEMLAQIGAFNRKPIMWELWQVIKGHKLNEIDYSSYTIINDYTCDVDNPNDLKKIEEKMSNESQLYKAYMTLKEYCYGQTGCKECIFVDCRSDCGLYCPVCELIEDENVETVMEDIG